MNRYTVTRDARLLSTHDTEDEAWRYLLRQQGQSVYYATLHGGYDIVYPNGTKLSDTYKKESK
jgi:hypothetical protein